MKKIILLSAWVLIFLTLLLFILSGCAIEEQPTLINDDGSLNKELLYETLGVDPPKAERTPPSRVLQGFEVKPLAEQWLKPIDGKPFNYANMAKIVDYRIKELVRINHDGRP